GAAEGEVRDRRRQGEPEPSGRAVLRCTRAREEGPGCARGGGLRCPEEAMRRAFTFALVFATALSLAFLLLPVVAIFLRVSPGHLFAQLGNHVARDALLVSLKTNLIAEALILIVGTPAAYFLARRRFPGRALVL